MAPKPNVPPPRTRQDPAPSPLARAGTGPCVGWLVSRSTPPLELELRAGAEVVIGRALDSCVVLGHNAISRRHATLHCGADGLVLSDLGSHNGTTVNGRRVSGPTTLRPGDALQLGPYHLVVRPPGGAAPVDPLVALAAEDAELAGTVQEVDVRAVLRGVEQHRRTGTLRVEAPEGTGRVLFARGRPTNARFAGKFDDAAVLAMLRLRAGTVQFRPVVQEKVETTMSRTIAQLLTDAAREEREVRRSHDRKVEAEARAAFDDISAMFRDDDDDGPAAAAPDEDDDPGADTAVFGRPVICAACGARRTAIERVCPACGSHGRR